MPQIGEGQWRSLNELSGDDRSPAAEFATLDSASAPDRRETMKLMAAAWALGGVSGCSPPDERLIPAPCEPVCPVGATMHDSEGAGSPGGANDNVRRRTRQIG
jgi:hypothetical protein